MKKNILIVGLVVMVTVLGTSLFWKTKNKEVVEVEPTPPEKLIGGDKDEHGCLIAAGYSWCEEKSKCLRVWEELCDESAALKTVIKEALVAKHGNSANALTITVSKIKDTYAQGGAGGEGGGHARRHVSGRRTAGQPIRFWRSRVIGEHSCRLPL